MEQDKGHHSNASAEFGPLMEAYRRRKLIDLVPLAQPLSMMVDPSSACNFRCRFCPTGDLDLLRSAGRKMKLMPLDLFRKIICDINDFEESLAVLRLYKDGEPLLNPDFVEFVRLAKACHRIERVETTTNGSKLTRSLNTQLISAGLDRIVISIEGVTREKYQEFARVHFDLDRLMDTLSHLYQIRGTCQVHIKTVKENLEEGEDQRFIELFSEVADRIDIENTVPSWPSFEVANLENEMKDQVDAFNHPVVRKKVCPYLFYSLSVNSDGSVSPCCVDWDRKLVLGDAANVHLLNIWTGKELNQLRYRHLKYGRSTVGSCKCCGQIDYCSSEHLDPHAKHILEKMGWDKREI